MLNTKVQNALRVIIEIRTGLGERIYSGAWKMFCIFNWPFKTWFEDYRYKIKINCTITSLVKHKAWTTFSTRLEKLSQYQVMSGSNQVKTSWSSYNPEVSKLVHGPHLAHVAVLSSLLPSSCACVQEVGMCVHVGGGCGVCACTWAGHVRVPLALKNIIIMWPSVWKVWRPLL